MVRHGSILAVMATSTACCWTAISSTTGFVVSPPSTFHSTWQSAAVDCRLRQQRARAIPFAMCAKTNSDEEWTDFPPLPNDNNNNSPNNKDKKLGIDIGKMLDPMSPAEAASLKVAATEIINDAVAAGLDDLTSLRRELQQDLQRQGEQRAQQSQLVGQQAEAQLLTKIDQLTNDFLSSTQSSRTLTKAAAAADQAMTGRGLEVGAWGRVGSSTVPMSLLGSVSAAAAQQGATPSTSSTSSPKGILILADTTSDPYAKQLVEPLTTALQQQFAPTAQLPVTVYKPTATIPLGGDNAAAVVLFCTSFSDPTSVQAALDRILRTTLQTNGMVGQPPTQIVAISSLGTTRLEKVPYSFQNVMGGKLSKRRQMEEAVIRVARDRAARGGTTSAAATTTAIDYTICNLGELKADTKEPFQFRAGDAVDGTLAIDTAVTVLTQAICLQPSARNATLSCVGRLNMDANDSWQAILDDAFMRLDGPELLRFDLADNDKDYDQLVEYTKEWAELLAESGKGLTTPIRAEVPTTVSPTMGVKHQGAVKLLFLPTATGKNYVSKEDERKMAAETGTKASVQSPVVSRFRPSNDGGIEFVVEVTDSGNLRARAKRCNYADGVVVKELSEETILGSFRKCIEVWKKDHQQR
jgi:hypothetical protein